MWMKVNTEGSHIIIKINSFEMQSTNYHYQSLIILWCFVFYIFSIWKCRTTDAGSTPFSACRFPGESYPVSCFERAIILCNCGVCVTAIMFLYL